MNMDNSWSRLSTDAERWERLTAKQRACLDLLLARHTSKQIARQLGISKDTVDQRITAARKTLGAADRNETAMAYARLKAIYDRVVYDPALLAPPPALVPSDFPDGNPATAIALDDSASRPDGSPEIYPPFRDIRRHDHGLTTRIVILAAMLITAVILILAGLAIGHTLTRLVSG